MKLLASIFMTLLFVACSTPPVSHPQATPRSPSAVECTAICAMEDDTRFVNVDLNPTLTKNFGSIAGNSMEELFRKCDILVKTAIKNDQVPYSLPNVISMDTLFSPRLYNNLEIVRCGSYECIHSRSAHATAENSCK